MSTHLAIQPLTDAVAADLGYDARSAYVEMFWLPTIGPTALLLLRHLAHLLERNPEGIHLPIGETAQALGIGNREGNQSPVRKSLDRLVQFDLARSLGGAAYSVRTTVPLVSVRHLRRIPDATRIQLPRWHADKTEPDALSRARQRARRIAAVLALEGASSEQIERAVASQGVHPALVFEAAQWAVRQLRELRSEPCVA
jgi:hypothetical protein